MYFSLRPTTDPVVATFHILDHDYTISTAPASGSMMDTIRITVRAVLIVVFCLILLRAIYNTLSQA